VSAALEVRVPDMGSFKDVVVIDVLVKAGDRIEVDGSLLTLETEKATMDVPSTVAGIVERVAVAKGGTVSAGDVIAFVRPLGEGGAGVAGSEGSAGSAIAPDGGDAKDLGDGAVVAHGARSADRARGADPAHSDDRVRSPAGTAAAAVATPVAVTEGNGLIATAPAPAAATPEPGREAARAGALPLIDEPGFSRAHASPSVRRFARELGVDLGKVTGTGIKGRILDSDVKSFVKITLSAPVTAGASAGAGALSRPASGLPQVPEIDFAAFGPIETRPLTRVQRISGPRLHASWVNLPHVTQFDEVDITELEDARSKLKQKALQEGIKLTPLAFLVRACVKALQEFPTINASLDATGQNLVLKRYFHIGFAADTPQGLLVPVIRNADRKDVYEIARVLGELSEKARTGKLAAAEMQGGSFTISSLGGIGGTSFTPIINAPEVAILGVSRSAMKPVYVNGAFVPRLMLPLSLSYDHRVVDGALGARFITFLGATLSDPRALLEAVP
jgi:pyruvate dehydrogenase E2 component (dihydrolipoamide acetyltransferase)